LTFCRNKKLLFLLKLQTLGASNSGVLPAALSRVSSDKYWRVEKLFTSKKVAEFSKLSSPTLKLFFTHLVWSHLLTEALYRVHPFNKFYFISTQVNSSTPSLNLTSLFFRWQHASKFLYSLLYSQSTLYLFSHRNLEVETTSLNFNLVSLDKRLRANLPHFFIHRESPYSYLTSFIFLKLSYKSTLTAFILDINFFKKSLFFLKKSNFYTIGLLPYSVSPWSLHYPILVATSTILTQYFFLKYLTLLYQSSKSDYYNHLTRSFS
jgi:hypothetical protein